MMPDGKGFVVSSHLGAAEVTAGGLQGHETVCVKSPGSGMIAFVSASQGSLFPARPLAVGLLV